MHHGLVWVGEVFIIIGIWKILRSQIYFVLKRERTENWGDAKSVKQAATINVKSENVTTVFLRKKLKGFPLSLEENHTELELCIALFQREEKTQQLLSEKICTERPTIYKEREVQGGGEGEERRFIIAAWPSPMFHGMAPVWITGAFAREVVLPLHGMERTKGSFCNMTSCYQGNGRGQSPRWSEPKRTLRINSLHWICKKKNVRKLWQKTPEKHEVLLQDPPKNGGKDENK